ncbi:hypothetical protein ACQ4M3_19255 [Leptolyngbya sp. AN03gr2]|uniref:hypothetical protein n=1 Tax=Leptolyngbya sp. AN03gr2 TaxID=3423364 RepID=UPI003D31E36F
MSQQYSVFIEVSFSTLVTIPDGVDPHEYIEGLTLSIPTDQIQVERMNGVRKESVEAAISGYSVFCVESDEGQRPSTKVTGLPA